MSISLRISIYGLKQAPRAWFSKLTDRLLTLDFTASKSDSTLFILRNNFEFIYVLIYVDDIVITGSCSVLISQFIRALCAFFSQKSWTIALFFRHRDCP